MEARKMGLSDKIKLSKKRFLKSPTLSQINPASFASIVEFESLDGKK
jgi:hypothetical protein